jgi:hypothetical protein
MAEPSLDGSGVMGLVGQRVAAGVAQHVRVRLEIEAGTGGGALGQWRSNAAGTSRSNTALANPPRRCRHFNQKREHKMNTQITGPPAPTILLTDQARQGVTGHNVRYVLGFGLAGVVTALVLIGFLASQGWLGTL